MKQYIARRKAIFDDLAQGYDPKLMRDPVFCKALETFAVLCEQEERLLKFIDENGFTYSKFNTQGDEIPVVRPETGVLRNIQESKIRESKRLLQYERVTDEHEEGSDLIA
jgi:hypothetical protein